ncbi:MAG: protein kinase, partial [Bdellovibrionales bacterium]|nr:protein kinase [Bdellovibrionales bacterium]
METIDENGEFHESRDLRFELEPGQLIENRYEVVKKLGSGATASVYKCKDKLLGNLEVAIKIFRYNKNLSEEVVTRLSREIWASFGINHGNVARFYECIRNENILGLVMEYI